MIVPACLLSFIFVFEYAITEIVRKIDTDVHDISRIEGFLSHAKGVVFFDDQSRIFSLSNDGKLKATWGGRGQGPGQFDASILHLGLVGDHFLVVSDFGRRQDLFQRDGTGIGRRTVTDATRPLLWQGTDVLVALDSSFTESHRTLRVDFVNEDRSHVIDIATDDEDVIRGIRSKVQQHGHYLMIVTAFGLKGRFYYGIFDLSDKGFLDVGFKSIVGPKRGDTIEQARKMNKALPKDGSQGFYSIPIIDSITSHKDWGFVLSETSQEKSRIVWIMNPKDNTWKHIEIALGPMSALSSIVHLENDLWGGYDENTFVVFRIEKKP